MAVAFLCLSMIGQAEADGQVSGIVPINSELESLLIRQYTEGNLPGFDIGRLPLSAGESIRMLSHLQEIKGEMSARDQKVLERYHGLDETDRRDGLFFKDGLNYFSTYTDSYSILVNPLADLSLGGFSSDAPTGESGVYWRNRRGIRVTGTVGEHFFFESNIEEVQEKTVDPTLLSKGTIPRYRVVRFRPVTTKDEEGNAVNSADRNSLDYGPTHGVIGFRTNHFEFRLGRDRYRLGPGLNSLFLSNYATEYDHFLGSVALGKLHYTYIVASLRDKDAISRNGTAGRKAGIWHRLRVSVTDRTSLELYQGVILGVDSTSASASAFDIGMLNPMIFLRQYEKDFDRFGNKVLGLAAESIVRDGYRVYGQIFLDELVNDQIFSGDGFWANKWGFLIGGHVVNVGDLPVDIQIEYSRIRPFTYSHHHSASNYVHYNDNLGHRLGANFHELSGRMHTSLGHRVSLTVNASLAEAGTSDSETNFGDDPRLGYNSRNADFGVSTLQGVRRRFGAIEGTVSIRILPQTHVDLFGMMEDRPYPVSPRSRNTLAGLRLRIGLSPESKLW